MTAPCHEDAFCAQQCQFFRHFIFEFALFIMKKIPAAFLRGDPWNGACEKNSIADVVKEVHRSCGFDGAGSLQSRLRHGNVVHGAVGVTAELRILHAGGKPELFGGKMGKSARVVIVPVGKDDSGALFKRNTESFQIALA